MASSHRTSAGPLKLRPSKDDGLMPVSTAEEVDVQEPWVTDDFGKDAQPLSMWYSRLQTRVSELRQLLEESQNASYERFQHRQMVSAGAASRALPSFSVHDYHEELKKVRRASQVYYANATEVYRDLDWEDVGLEDPRDYTHCRYTPIITQDARDFPGDGYKLRVQENGKRIKLLICVTLYNEDQETLNKTLLGLCENLEVLFRQYGRGGGNRYGLDWQQVAVVIVQDGMSKADKGVLASSTVQGFFSPSLLQEEVCGQPTVAHLFEYTARYKKHAGLDSYPPLQVLLATKVVNKGKLDSHCWFFDAFSQLLQPDFCVLFDAGTRPRPFALRNLYAYFQRFPKVGACTGELTVERPWRNFMSIIQYIEWKVAHLLNKPLESLCGYLTVLPGAFSAYRWAAIEGEPLRRYFHGLYSEAELSAFEANMYLAEDRILCLEIVVRQNSAYRLEYVKEAVAEADPVMKLTDLLKQRRRWLNGTFFAMIYTLTNWRRVWTDSHHGVLRKLAISGEFLYLTFLTMIGTWFGIGILYTIFYNVAVSTFNDSYWSMQAAQYLILGYQFLIAIQVVVSLKNKPEPVATVHQFCAIFFCAYMLLFTGITIKWLATDAGGFGAISSLGVIMSVAGLFLTALLHGDILSLIGGFLQYWMFQPVYLNMLQVYAFANTDDISWGTKNLDAKKDMSSANAMMKSGLAHSGPQSRESKAFWEAMMDAHNHLIDFELVKKYNAKKEQKLKAFATYLLLAWVLTNMLFFQVIQMVCNISWQVCKYDGAAAYANEVKSRLAASSDDKQMLSAVGSVLYAAAAILKDGTQNYPFGGLPEDPDAYPVLLSGKAQSSSSLGKPVTVLTDSADVLRSLSGSMPRFDQWVNYTTGVNLNDTMQDLKLLDLPDPSQFEGQGEVTCHLEFGRQYYMLIQFWVLAIIVILQVGGSLVYILKYYFQRAAWRFENRRHKHGSGGSCAGAKKDDGPAPTRHEAVLDMDGIGAYPGHSRHDSSTSSIDEATGLPKGTLQRTLSKPKERRLSILGGFGKDKSGSRGGGTAVAGGSGSSSASSSATGSPMAGGSGRIKSSAPGDAELKRQSSV